MALLGLTNSLSREGSIHNIRVNSLCPMVTTPMTEKHLALPVQPLFDECTFGGRVVSAQ